jgi:PAS domain-containing serine/threonine kinase
MSQCDDDQTCGDYGELYTTLQQIGKGAFGYVKMAFRNEDGLLVCISMNQKVYLALTLQENVHFAIVIMFLTHCFWTGT